LCSLELDGHACTPRKRGAGDNLAFAIIIIVGGCLGSGGLGVTLLAGSGKKRGRKEKCLLDGIKGVPPRRKAHFDATHNFVMKGPNR